MSAFATFRLGWGSAAQGPGGPGKGAAPAVNTGLNSLTWGRPGVVRGKEALLRCWGAELGMVVQTMGRRSQACFVFLCQVFSSICRK